MRQLIGPFREIATMADMPLRGVLRDAQLPLIREGGLLFEDGKIVAVASYETLLKKEKKAKLIVVSEDRVVLPGLIDAHTHIAFGGTRAQDFALRNAGCSYLDIAEKGGGIWSSVGATRAHTQAELQDLVVLRAERLIRQGITTIEVKSGYGLSVAEELKILRAIKGAQTQTSARLVPTCLAAHTLPKDFKGSAEAYLAWISAELFPKLLEAQLTTRIDAFVEKGAFSAEEIIPYYERARAMGFDLTIHADQFSVSGSEVAVRMGVRSADHLECSGDPQIALLAQSEVIPVALPGASMGLGCAFTPARKLLDAGASLAIATDWNPGSAPMGHLITQAAVLACYEKLSNAEVFAGLTYRAAQALGLSDCGALAEGKKADFILFPTKDIREILYHQGQMPPVQVWISGVCVYGNERIA